MELIMDSMKAVKLMTTANDILAVARKYVGSVEYSTNHKHILSVYNSTKPLPRGYTVKLSDDWCATYVSFVGIEAGVPNLFGRECGVERFVDIFKAKGIWQENGSITPRPGDIIVFNWDDSTESNDGFADHIGFVESVANGTITTIEGNKSNSVSRRSIPVGWGYIRGYAQPKYGTSSSGQKSITDIAQEVINGLWGNGADRTSALQKAGYDPNAVQNEVNRILKGNTSSQSPSVPQIAEDGDWGTATTRLLQQVYGTCVDGVISHQYKTSANAYLYSAQFDSTLIGSNLIKEIQRTLGLTADGLCGTDTIKAMQRKLGTPVDGILSPNGAMVKVMQRKLNANQRPF